MKHNKQNLKQGYYYYEEKPFFDMLPDEIEVPEYKTEIFTETLTNKEILEKYNIKPYTLEQATGVVLDIIPTLQNDWKAKIVFLKYEDTLFRFFCYRDDVGQLYLHVVQVRLDDEWSAGYGVCFSNETQTLRPETLTANTLSTRYSSNPDVHFRQAEELAITFCDKYCDSKARAVVELRDMIMKM